jgi:hypothetical protein
MKNVIALIAALVISSQAAAQSNDCELAEVFAYAAMSERLDIDNVMVHNAQMDAEAEEYKNAGEFDQAAEDAWRNMVFKAYQEQGSAPSFAHHKIATSFANQEAASCLQSN